MVARRLHKSRVFQIIGRMARQSSWVGPRPFRHHDRAGQRQAAIHRRNRRREHLPVAPAPIRPPQSPPGAPETAPRSGCWRPQRRHPARARSANPIDLGRNRRTRPVQLIPRQTQTILQSPRSAKIAGNGRYPIRSRPERARAQTAPPVRSLRRQNPFHRAILGARQRRARLHRRRQVYQPRLDRVDSGFPVRLRHPPVRCHRRCRIPRDRAPANGAPVFTVGGKYTSRGWTEWTQGFQFGSAILQFDATGDAEFLEIGRRRTVDLMAPHLSHTGVHDHGFNNVSTYGNLLRLMTEGRIAENLWERRFYQVALKVSGAAQAARWSRTAEGGGYIYSFNGPHSLFVDTIRTLRAPAVSHLLGHVLMGENDRRISLIDRVAQHARATARYAVWYGEGRDAYDVRGRTAHESIFNVNDGNYRCPNSQQGYSPFSTWTRGLAWAMCGFAEQLELFDTLPGHEETIAIMEKAACATCDFYLAHT